MNSPLQEHSAFRQSDPATYDEFSSQLQSGLQLAVQSREQATPEPTCDPTNTPQAQRYLCGLQRDHFKSSEAEKLRQSITDTHYWKCEVDAFQAEVEFLLSGLGRNAQWKCEVDAFQAQVELLLLSGPGRNAESLRLLAKGYKDICRRLGLSSRDIEGVRQNILHFDYWRTEETLFEYQSRLRTFQLRQSSRKSTKQRKRLNQSEGQSDWVSSRTRSKTGGVMKRRR